MKLDNRSRLFNLLERPPSRIDACSPAPPTIFMHIPKTSGMALTSALTEAIAPSKVVFGYDRVLFGAFEGFDSISPDLRRSIYLGPKSLPSDAEFVSGHISFSTFSENYQNATYITVLREPISRILSLWLYWRTQSDDQLRAWGDWAERVCISHRSLLYFLSSKDIACQTDNICVRMLLWPHPLIPDSGFIDESNDETLLDQATDRLNQFAYIDVVENPEFQENIEKWLGREVTYRRINETPSIPEMRRTPLHEELKPEIFSLLEVRSRLDLKLWTAVARQRVSRWDAESLRTYTIMLNAARYARL